MIHYKIDWFQGRCFNRSVQSVVSLFGLDEAFCQFIAGDLMPHERMTGYGSHYVFAVDDFRIVINREHFNAHLAIDPEWDWYLDPIGDFGLEISGQGLDQLRANGFEVDRYLTDPDWLQVPDYFRPTRADFAFDYVNCNAYFMDQALAFCEQSMFQGKLRLITGVGGGISYSVHHSPLEQTIYFGTTRSDHLVRCYNKKLQVDPYGLDPEAYPENFAEEGEIKSWFRIELQARRQVAVDCLYQPLEFRKFIGETDYFAEASPIAYVLGYIKSNFLIQDPNTRTVLPFFADLFQWEKLPPLRRFKILYNTGNGLRIDAVKACVSRNARGIIEYIALFGIQGLFNELQHTLLEWQQSESVTARRRYNAFVSDLASLSTETSYKRCDFHLDFDNGQIKLSSEVKPI